MRKDIRGYPLGWPKISPHFPRPTCKTHKPQNTQTGKPGSQDPGLHSDADFLCCLFGTRVRHVSGFVTLRRTSLLFGFTRRGRCGRCVRLLVRVGDILPCAKFAHSVKVCGGREGRPRVSILQVIHVRQRIACSQFVQCPDPPFPRQADVVPWL